MDPFLAYLDKMEADFRTAIDNLRQARKVYATFLALRREQAFQGRADTPSEPSPPAEQSVNASLLPGQTAGMVKGEGGHVGTNATATPMPPGDRCEPRGEPHIRMSPLGPVLSTAPPDELEIPKFLDRRM